MITSTPLTDTQLVLLSAASQREDGLLVQPDRLKGVIAQSVTSKLLARAYIEEVLVGRDGPHWRQDDDGRPIGFRITSAGLRAIGVESETVSADSALIVSARAVDQALSLQPQEKTPRAGTKKALVLSPSARGGHHP